MEMAAFALIELLLILIKQYVNTRHGPRLFRSDPPNDKSNFAQRITFSSKFLYCLLFQSFYLDWYYAHRKQGRISLLP